MDETAIEPIKATVTWNLADMDSKREFELAMKGSGLCVAIWEISNIARAWYNGKSMRFESILADTKMTDSEKIHNAIEAMCEEIFEAIDNSSYSERDMI